MNVTVKDREILRALGEKYMSYAVLSAQKESKRLWTKLNSLEMEKPMLAIDQLPWHELDVDGSLICQVENPLFRTVEWDLRMAIYRWEHLPVDMVMEPYILIPRPITDTDYGVDIEEERCVMDQQNDIVGHSYINQFEEPEDVEKIKTPVITVDRALEAEILSLAEDIFAGIAPVRLKGMKLHLGLWDFLAQRMSIENCYFDLMERPEFLHALMERMTEATIAKIEQINQQGLYDINEHICHCSYTYSNTLPSESCDHNNPTTYDGWAFGMAQLFSSCSPAVTEEFEVTYMKRLFPYFGSIYYGCCERLDDRLPILEQLPNVRKISCSPWSDREHFAEVLPKKYIMSNKPNPALLAGDTFDEELVRADLRRTMDAAKQNGVALELILKDVSTVRYDPQRLWRWAEIASEEAKRSAGC